jgi:hypothetical protein
MQTITPVDVHVENQWRDSRPQGLYVKKGTNTGNRTTTPTNGRQGSRIRTCVTNKTKITKSKSAQLPPPIVQVKTVVPTRSRSPSPPTRDPW